MTSSEKIKSYHQPHYDVQDIPQPNVYEDGGDIIPYPDAAEGYVISKGDDEIRKKNESSDHEATVQALLAEAEGAAARQEIRDWGTQKLEEQYRDLYEKFLQARDSNDTVETARLRALVEKKAEEIRNRDKYADGSGNSQDS